MYRLLTDAKPEQRPIIEEEIKKGKIKTTVALRKFKKGIDTKNIPKVTKKKPKEVDVITTIKPDVSLAKKIVALDMEIELKQKELNSLIHKRNKLLSEYMG